MTYQVNFQFFDGKELPIQVSDEELENFLDEIGEGKVYFSPKKLNGVWIHSAQVRCFHFQKTEEKRPQTQKPEEKNEKTKQSGQNGRKSGDAKGKRVD